MGGPPLQRPTSYTLLLFIFHIIIIIITHLIIVSSSSFSSSPRILSPQSLYHISLSLHLPFSPPNKNLGPFMIHATLLDDGGRPLATSKRPGLLPYESHFVDKVRNVLFLFPLLIGAMTEVTKVVTVILFEGFMENGERPLSTVRVRLIPSPRHRLSSIGSGDGGGETIHVASASLRIGKERNVVQSFMAEWFYTCGILGTLYIMFCQVVMYLIIRHCYRRGRRIREETSSDRDDDDDEDYHRGFDDDNHDWRSFDADEDNVMSSSSFDSDVDKPMDDNHDDLDDEQWDYYPQDGEEMMEGNNSKSSSHEPVAESLSCDEKKEYKACKNYETNDEEPHLENDIDDDDNCISLNEGDDQRRERQGIQRDVPISEQSSFTASMESNRTNGNPPHTTTRTTKKQPVKQQQESTTTTAAAKVINDNNTTNRYYNRDKMEKTDERTTTSQRRRSQRSSKPTSSSGREFTHCDDDTTTSSFKNNDRSNNSKTFSRTDKQKREETIKAQKVIRGYYQPYEIFTDLDDPDFY